ncbi:AAA family ATPase [Filibacter tadaridae]|uniref:Chromosome segregation protein n=1 Tax=Filibacter tadaridae TaxID=2483811 RepID=A0A3P5XBM6_9BACL|nr:AAA family ATPase [Filibacter tadaridae]VDC25877.1 chromosome segregation protein [Filibacter tadaridae]
MRIEKLIIYGFGKHENVTIDFGPGMNVLYGLNEAGKTTIQQFILHVLFGFPPKNNATLRYEPKSGGKYGGQVQLMDDTFGKCTVERVRGKSAGDVTVFFEEGSKGGEETLKALMRQYDRTSFESIFSFSLLQLQGFEKMDEEELSRALLASGTTGVDSLLQLEKRMEKEMSELFKKSGKNPEMNSKMAELRELEVELKAEQQKVEAYMPSVHRIQEVEGYLVNLRKEEKTLQNDLQQVSLIRQLLPLHHKKKELETRLSHVRSVNFPADGIRRLESLTGRLAETEAAKRRLKKEQAEMVAGMPKQHDVERIGEIDALLAKESEWHSWHTVSGAAEDEERQLTSSYRRLFDRLGIRTADAETALLQANVSIQKEQEMHRLLAELTNKEQQIRMTENKRSDLESELADTEKRLGTVEQIAPSVNEVESVQKWPELRERLAEAKAYIALGKSSSKQDSLKVPALLSILALICITFGFIQQEWLIGILGVIFGGAALFFYSKRETDKTGKQKQQEMESFVAKHAGKEQQMTELIERLNTYNRNRDRLHEEYMSLELKYQQTEVELEKLKGFKRQKEIELAHFLEQYGLESELSKEVIPELFRMIREVQEITQSLKGSRLRRQASEERIAERALEIEKALQKTMSKEVMYEMLRREYFLLKEQLELFTSLTTDMKRIESDLLETAELSASLRTTIQQLLTEAEAETETEFYTAYDDFQEVVRLTQQLQDIQVQLDTYGQLESPTGLTEGELVLKVDGNERRLREISSEINTLVAENAALVHHTEQLLTDENVGRKQQLFEMKKAELAELAKKWSERKVVAEAIRHTVAELKEKKLPEVLGFAEEMFCKLTGGNYTALVVTATGRFEALSINGMYYPIVELSQATKEQAYIALRLSLATSVHNTAPFPIMMDDPFVHFDEKRLSRMIDVLDHYQYKHQCIYFTCHESMKERWKDATILNVSDIGSNQGAIVS